MQKFISKFSLSYRNHIIKKDVSIKAGGKCIEKAPSKNTKAYELLENRRQIKPAHQKSTHRGKKFVQGAKTY